MNAGVKCTHITATWECGLDERKGVLGGCETGLRSADVCWRELKPKGAGKPALQGNARGSPKSLGVGWEEESGKMDQKGKDVFVYLETKES